MTPSSARPLQRLLREALEDPLAGEVLFGRPRQGRHGHCGAPEGGDKLVLRLKKNRAKIAGKGRAQTFLDPPSKAHVFIRPCFRVPCEMKGGMGQMDS